MDAAEVDTFSAKTEGSVEMNIAKQALKTALSSFGYEVSRLRKDIYDEVGLRTIHNHDFLLEKNFMAAFDAGVKASRDDPNQYGSWRVHVALWVAANAFRQGGDFVECGVHRGAMSSATLTYVDWNSSCENRHFYLFDTFSGFVATQVSNEEKKLGRLSDHQNRFRDASTYKIALDNFRSFTNVHVVKGVVPEVLTSQPISRVSYLHLDMNCAAPEVAALEYFWPKLADGGMVLMDDYAFLGYAPQNIALNETAARFGRVILSLPTGQGLLIK
jgi:hypothetical protein